MGGHKLGPQEDSKLYQAMEKIHTQCTKNMCKTDRNVTRNHTYISVIVYVLSICVDLYTSFLLHFDIFKFSWHAYLSMWQLPSSDTEAEQVAVQSGQKYGTIYGCRIIERHHDKFYSFSYWVEFISVCAVAWQWPESDIAIHVEHASLRPTRSILCGYIATKMLKDTLLMTTLLNFSA